MSRAGAVSYSLPISTTFELPGMRVVESRGSCFGLVVRSMGLVKGFAAGFQTLRQGEVAQYTELLEDSRRHAIDRMVDNARLRDPAARVMRVWIDPTNGARHYAEARP
jgi:uncharacterized protein YbjQ (UPF0145 family)